MLLILPGDHFKFMLQGLSGMLSHLRDQEAGPLDQYFMLFTISCTMKQMDRSLHTEFDSYTLRG